MSESRSTESPDPAERERLVQLAAVLAEQRAGLRTISYRQAEADCDRLGSLLIEAVGRQELGRFEFRPIPRGGLFVLGMLSYLLDLDASSLAPSETRGRPLVLVDDCALTGARLEAALRSTVSPEIVFAHLYSPPALRAAATAEEPRLRCCLAVHDLADRTDQMSVEERNRWWQRWRDRLGPGRYFYGKVDPLAFPWTEPDRPLWNRSAGAVESGWRLASPGSCLRNRGELGPPPAAQPRPRWQVPPGIASSELAGRLWLCNTADGDVLALDGTAKEIWRRLARHGDPAIAADEIAAAYQVEPDQVRRDVDRVAVELADRRFLERVHDGRD